MGDADNYRKLVLISAFINAYDVGGITGEQLRSLTINFGFTVRPAGPSIYEIRGPDRSVTLARPMPDRSMQLTPQPPALAERVLACLLPPWRLEEALGDAQEAYELMAERQGVRFARFWYRWQVSMVVLHGAFVGICRAIRIWSGFGQV